MYLHKKFEIRKRIFLKNMSLNKNAIIRYQTLDRCFRNPGRMYFWEDLLEECNQALREFDPNAKGIQRRQLFEDIRFMESEAGWSIPLARHRYGKRVYYRYEDVNFSINQQPLNPAEAEQLASALHVLSRFSGAPQFEWVNELITKLESQFKFHYQTNIISFDSNIDLKGLEFLQPLFHAILNQRVLAIDYKDFYNEFFTFIFHPYHLKQYNQRWFVVGLNEENQNPYWILALDRILRIQETDRTYQPFAFDWDEYFYDIVGVTRYADGQVVKVVLKVYPTSAPYILTKPLHPTQKHKIFEDYTLVEIQVIPNIELERLLLSYGEHVEVIAPIELREKMKARVKEMMRKYDEENPPPSPQQHTQTTQQQ